MEGMARLVPEGVVKHIGYYFDEIYSNQFEITIDGVKGFNKKGLLHKVVIQEAMARFREKLDFRTFVNVDDLSLINKPTNYYGVAKYRELLGFEKPCYTC